MPRRGLAGAIADADDCERASRASIRSGAGAQRQSERLRGCGGAVTPARPGRMSTTCTSPCGEKRGLDSPREVGRGVIGCKGQRALVEVLAGSGVQHIFGLARRHRDGVLRRAAMTTGAIEHIMTRDERSASFMADVYARVAAGSASAKDRAAAARPTSCPVSPKRRVRPSRCSADLRYPGQPAGPRRLTELDQESLFRPVTKWNTRVNSAATMARGDPPRDPDGHRGAAGRDPSVAADRFSRRRDARCFGLRCAGVRQRSRDADRPTRRSIERAAAELAAAERPVIVAGGGVLTSGAWNELTAWPRRSTFRSRPRSMAREHCRNERCRDRRHRRQRGAPVRQRLSWPTPISSSTSDHGPTPRRRATGRCRRWPRRRASFRSTSSRSKSGTTTRVVGLVGDAKLTLLRCSRRSPTRRGRGAQSSRGSSTCWRATPILGGCRAAGRDPRQPIKPHAGRARNARARSTTMTIIVADPGHADAVPERPIRAAAGGPDDGHPARSRRTRLRDPWRGRRLVCRGWAPRGRHDRRRQLRHVGRRARDHHPAGTADRHHPVLQRHLWLDQGAAAPLSRRPLLRRRFQSGRLCGDRPRVRFPSAR